jgi:hypothetical protein
MAGTSLEALATVDKAVGAPVDRHVDSSVGKSVRNPVENLFPACSKPVAKVLSGYA